MNIDKLKIDKFNGVKTFNFPEKYKLGIDESPTSVAVVIYYIDVLEDVKDFVDTVKSQNLPENNRVIFVYEKGRKDGVNRDSIFEPFKNGTYKGFKMRQPMLCSLSDKLSAFVQSYEG